LSIASFRKAFTNYLLKTKLRFFLIFLGFISTTKLDFKAYLVYLACVLFLGKIYSSIWLFRKLIFYKVSLKAS